MTDLVLALMAALLGAATLAIVLLYRGWKTHRAQLTQLQAQIATQQIAALTGSGPIPELEIQDTAEQEEPVRRKRHLALYIGGSVIAAFASLGDRLRRLWRDHRTLATTAVATVATVGTAAALYMAPAGDSGDSGDSSKEGRSDKVASAPERPTPGSSGRSIDSEGFGAEDTGVGSALSTNTTHIPGASGTRERSPSGATEPSSSGQTAAPGEDDGGDGAEDGSTPPTDQPNAPTPDQPPQAPEQPGDPSPPGQPNPPTTDQPPQAPEQPGDPSPTGPAQLTVGTPVRKATDKRWCEDVTLGFHNTGGSPVTSGTVTFGTHILGPLGGDWKTITQTRELPVPLQPGESTEGSWTLCVPSWRVPIGWHIETRDVAVALG
ncbi:hypothetical protein [Streptomyces sp. OE57]|uniref:hypothetical protein n=1 Tax=Streptomyces lacaronensis TaxID=3379885 RepID=UPI0039B74B0D